MNKKEIVEKKTYIEKFNMKFDSEKIKVELTPENYICNYNVPSRPDTKTVLSMIDIHANMKDNWDKFDKMDDLKGLAERRNIYPWWVMYEFKLYKLAYNDEYIKRMTPAIMKNLDLNLQFMEKLDSIDFNNSLNNLLSLKGNSKIKEVFDLNPYKKSTGIYILVLDKYKQIYIGQSTSSITQRILKHWKRKIEFESLLKGKTNETKISIDSFGIKDTTRIFIEEIKSISKINLREDFLIQNFPQDYILNKIGGGIKFETGEDFNRFMNTYQTRKLD